MFQAAHNDLKHTRCLDVDHPVCPLQLLLASDGLCVTQTSQTFQQLAEISKTFSFKKTNCPEKNHNNKKNHKANIVKLNETNSVHEI